MRNRRQFIGSGMAVTAASLGSRATASVPGSAGATGHSGVPPAAKPVGLFVFQSGDPEAVAAGRVMAGLGVPVIAFEDGRPDWLEQALDGIWARQPVRVVDLTGEPGFRTASAHAARLGHALAHRAPANRPGLINWILGPS